MKTLASTAYQFMKKMVFKPSDYCFDLILQNARQLHKAHVEKPVDLLELRGRLACHYLETYGQSAEPGRKARL